MASQKTSKLVRAVARSSWPRSAKPSLNVMAASAMSVTATRGVRPSRAKRCSTVVEADVRYSTDCGLAGGGVRVLAREGVAAGCQAWRDGGEDQ